MKNEQQETALLVIVLQDNPHFDSINQALTKRFSDKVKLAEKLKLRWLPEPGLVDIPMHHVNWEKIAEIYLGK